MATSPHLSRAWLWSQRHGMVLVALGLLAWCWGVSMWFLAAQKQQLLADRGAELALMAGAVAEQSASVLRAVDSNLRTVDLWLQTHPGADALRDPRLLALVNEMRRASRGAMDLRLVSTEGKLYYLPALDGQPRADVSDRGYVKAHAGNEGVSLQRTHIGEPVISRVTQHWDIPISRALASAPATAAGTGAPRDPSRPVMKIVFAAVSIDRLAGEHERMRFKPEGSIVLIRSDGRVLSRAPLVPAYLGLDLSGTPLFNREYGRQARGSFISEGSSTDGVVRLVSYEQLQDFPVTVLVTRGLDEIYATHYERLRTVLVLSVLLSVVVLAVTAFLHRLQMSQRAMQAAQSQLRRLATTDELTGVLNRRAFVEAARHEFERAQRYLRPTAVLALDIDHFKRVNDEYGHSGGDLVLRVCAQRWQAALREHDVLGRMGGEEFCVLLPETGAASAAAVAERLRSVTASGPIIGQWRTVSVSVGWATVDVADAAWEAVYERADNALYAAKAQGRNCVRPAMPAATTAPRGAEVHYLCTPTRGPR
jgi:diguanylate cyclase (GGDEF)-like protein